MIRNWGMGDKKVVDLSRFLRFEAAGDSEADLGDADDLGDDDDGDHEDDAESCVCDEGFHGSFQSTGVRIEISDDQDETYSDDDDGVRDLEGNDIHGIAHHHHHHKKSSAFEEDGEDEEEEGMISEVASTANSYSSRKCNVHSSTNKKMSEMEKNRLFWEACLAS